MFQVVTLQLGCRFVGSCKREWSTSVGAGPYLEHAKR
jgi:hypothetical protein